MGEHTYGKGRTQRVIPLEDGSTLLVSNTRLTTPLHHAIDRVGPRERHTNTRGCSALQSWGSGSRVGVGCWEHHNA
jgi:hypothetical protein